MAWDFYTATCPVARKDYACDASAAFHQCYGEEDVEGEKDITEYAAAKSDDFIIYKGQEYVKLVGKWEGEWLTYRARIDMDYIAEKYGCFDN